MSLYNFHAWRSFWQDLYEKQTRKWLDTGLKMVPDTGFAGPAGDLEPFTIDDKRTLFTSVDCAYKHQEHGYTYPELQKWRFTKNGQFDQEAYKRSIHADIERLYSTTPKAALLLKSNEEVAKAQMTAMTAENLQVENFPPPLLALASKVAVDMAQTPFQWIFDSSWGNPAPATWESNDYVINVIYERFALEGDTYAVNFFLGDVPTHSSIDFSEDLTAISRVYNFSSRAEGRGGPSGCESCKRKRDGNAKSSGQVVLTDYLIEHIVRGEPHRGLTLTSLDKDEVVPYLKKNLHWRIVDSRDQIIPKENMPSLKISVAMAEGTHSSDASQPSIFSAYTTLWDVTTGRLAGAAVGDL